LTEHRERQIPFAPFDSTDVRAVDFGVSGEIFLRPAQTLPFLSDPVAELLEFF
jgi:hypothetical protein